MLSTSDIKQMRPDELEREIPELENAYAEALRDETDVHLLNMIWRRIRELRAELQRRNDLPSNN